jgi:glycosyltransferase involved in cell wall biosynthesis
MRILFVHNFYQLSGGEDFVYRNEIAMLTKAGHDVSEFNIHNNSINGTFRKIAALASLVFSIPVFFKILKVLKAESPEVVHVHNYFPLISPSVFYACKIKGIPVVHTLHNFRAICPTALLMHNDKVTEKSIINGPWWAVKLRVYRTSLIGTLALAIMIAFHKKIRTWDKVVDGYICLTDFSKQLYIKAGWPKEKLYIKPNFIEDTNVDNIMDSQLTSEPYAIFVGRICKEKGISQLLDAWRNIDFTLIIIGDGPEKKLLAGNLKNVKYLGPKSKEEVLYYIKRAQFIIMASTWYEGFPMVLVEAFSQGTCALVPNLGGMAEIVEHQSTGLLFDPTQTFDLQNQAKQLISNLQMCNEYGSNAKQIFKEKYSEKVNYRTLEGIYKDVIIKKLNSRREL